MAAFLAFQPIFDAQQETIQAYAIVYRDSLTEGSDETAAKAISSLFSVPSGLQIINNKTAYITFTEQLLKANVAHLFSKDKLVIRMNDELAIQSALQENIDSLHKEGYRLALNNFQFNARSLNLLSMVDTVIINIEHMNDEQLDNIVGICRSFNKQLMAENINTMADYERAKAHGLQLLQGMYFEDVQIVPMQKNMEAGKSSFLRVAQLLTQEVPDVDEVAAVISSDVSMSYKLLRLVNSVYFSLRNKVSTVKQAVITMGTKQLRNWIYLLSFEDSADEKTMELMRISFLRGALCQALAPDVSSMDLDSETCYLVGMFSTLDRLMQMPLADALEELPLNDATKAALLEHEGPAGKLLAMVEAYEKSRWLEVNSLAEQLSLSTNLIGRKYLECVETVSDTWGKLMQGSN